jgi:hypothetical protein
MNCRIVAGHCGDVFERLEAPGANRCVLAAADQRRARHRQAPDGRSVLFEHRDDAQSFVRRIDRRYLRRGGETTRSVIKNIHTQKTAMPTNRLLRCGGPRGSWIAIHSSRQQFHELFMLLQCSLLCRVESLGVRLELVRQSRERVRETQQRGCNLVDTSVTRRCGDQRRRRHGRVRRTTAVLRRRYAVRVVVVVDRYAVDDQPVVVLHTTSTQDEKIFSVRVFATNKSRN